MFLAPSRCAATRVPSWKPKFTSNRWFQGIAFPLRDIGITRDPDFPRFQFELTHLPLFIWKAIKIFVEKICKIYRYSDEQSRIRYYRWRFRYEIRRTEVDLSIRKIIINIRRLFYVIFFKFAAVENKSLYRKKVEVAISNVKFSQIYYL